MWTDSRTGTGVKRTSKKAGCSKVARIEYVWWVDRKRASLVSQTREYLENVFYNCLGEQKRFVVFLKECQMQAHR